MKSILSMLLILACAFAQASEPILVITPATGESNWLTFDASGKQVLTPAKIPIIILENGSGSPPVNPDDPDTPTDPPSAGDSDREAVKKLAAAIGEPDAAKGLSLLYSDTADKLAKGKVTVAEANQWINYAYGLVVVNQKGSKAEWAAFKQEVEKLAAQKLQEGKLSTPKEWETFLESVAGGLDDVAAGSKLKLGELLKFLADLFELFLKLKAGGLF